MNVELFKNSVDILLNPEGLIKNYLNMENLKNVVSINYNNVESLEKFFETKDGLLILNKVKQNLIHLNLFPLDSVGVTNSEINFLIDNKDFFTKTNVDFYQSWIIKEINFNLYFGSTIHSAMHYILTQSENINFDFDKKQKHFLTLNNLYRPNRNDLFDYYSALNFNNREKFLCSFNFKNIYLEFDTFSQPHTIDLTMYGNNIIEFYNKSFFEIVVESSYISITEKSFKPLICGVPFIYWGVSIHSFPQMEYFNYLGIDVNYFDIDYKTPSDLENKINEILNTPNDKLFTKYKSAFDKAKSNKEKIVKYIKNIENKIIL